MNNYHTEPTEDTDLASWDVCLFCGEWFAIGTDWPYCSLLCACRASLDSMEDDI